MSKERVLEYCRQYDRSTIEHMEQAIENQKLIQEGRLRELNGCPSGFGLEEHIGLCELEEPLLKHEVTSDICERCWQQALNTEVKDRFQ